MTNDEVRMLGRVIGRDVTEIHFRSFKDEDIFLGEILIGQDGSTGRRFLLRVINIMHGVEARESDWASRAAGSMMDMDGRDEDFNIYDEDRRLYNVAVCAPLGYLEDGKFKKPKTIPAHFSKVRHAGPSDYEFLKNYLGDMKIGVLRSGERTISSVPVGIHTDVLCHHIGIFATTGMGKSNLMKRFGGAALESGKVGMLILDPHGEYIDGGSSELRGLEHHPLASQRLRCYVTREVGGNVSDVKISASEIGVQDLGNIYSLSDPQVEFLSAVRGRYGRGWLQYLNDTGIENLIEQYQPRFHEGTIGVVKRRIESIARSPYITFDDTVSMTDTVIQQLREGLVVLVDVSGAGEREELLVSSVLVRTLFERNKTIYKEKKDFERMPPTMIVLEEAQRVLGKSRGNIFAQIAREGRKFKTGLCAISQQPKLIDSQVISQFNSLFILGLADRMDREKLASSARQDVSKLDYEIQTLMVGEGLVVSPKTPFALPLKVDLYEEYIKTVKVGEEQNKEADATFF